MDADDFRKRCEGALILLKRLISQNKKVYVHCSAGMYRSPQIVVLYLVLHEGYKLEEAMSIVTERHAFARPNINIMNRIINNFQRKNDQKNNWKICNLN